MMEEKQIEINLNTLEATFDQRLPIDVVVKWHFDHCEVRIHLFAKLVHRETFKIDYNPILTNGLKLENEQIKFATLAIRTWANKKRPYDE